MTKTLAVLVLLLVAVSSIEEIKMTHKVRTPLEARMFIDYMNRGPMVQNVMKIMSNLFPTKKS